GAALVVWLLFVPLVVAAGALGVWLAPVILDVAPDQELPLRLAAAVLVVDALAVTVLTLPRSALQGENLGYTRMAISPLMVAVGGALMVAAVKLDTGLPGVATATVLTTTLTGWVFWRITRHRIHWFGAARPGRQLVRWFLGLSLWFLGWKFVLELILASDILVLAFFAPMTLVAAFALTKFVTDSLVQVLSLLVQATIPGIGGQLGSGNLARAAALRAEVMTLVWVVGTAAGATAIAWNGSFLGLWVGDDLFAGRGVTLLLAVLAVQAAMIRTDTFLIDVALEPKVKVIAGSASAVLSIVLAAVLVGPLDRGITGLCIGLLVGRSLLGVAAPLAVRRILGVGGRTPVLSLLRPLVVGLGLLALGYVVAGEIRADSWIALVAAVGVTLALNLAVAIVLGLGGPQRRRLVKRVVAMAGQLRRTP
ncbi:MAG TPA: hypothetical protein VLI04_23320, partial [Nocardioidaceae bacterium]|nr:hypothetical protein [Nocardioidaceae bacterium]